jgi:hypothetical protein
MHQFTGILTSLLFAAHAVFGCCTHHVHRSEGLVERQALCDDMHAGASEHSSHGDAPDEGHQHRGNGCEHFQCVYVKAEIEGGQIDLIDCGYSPAFAYSDIYSQTVSGSLRSLAASFAHADSTELYVWHCALLI